jgi:hypothetical protein
MLTKTDRTNGAGPKARRREVSISRGQRLAAASRQGAVKTREHQHAEFGSAVTGREHLRSVDANRAKRQARVAKAARDAAREAHERAIEKALADYFEARARAERIRATARARADAALADGERAAGESMTAVCMAIRTLRDLCGSNAEVAELCRVPVADVRELLGVAARAGRDGQRDGSA